MTIFIAYILVFFLAPLVGTLGGIVLTPISAIISIYLGSFLSGFITSLPEAFLAAWFGKLIFGLLGVTPGWGMIITVSVGFVLTNIDRVYKHGLSPWKAGSISGDLSGLLLFGIFML